MHEPEFEGEFFHAWPTAEVPFVGLQRTPQLPRSVARKIVARAELNTAWLYITTMPPREVGTEPAWNVNKLGN